LGWTRWVYPRYFVHFLVMYLQCTGLVNEPLSPVRRVPHGKREPTECERGGAVWGRAVQRASQEPLVRSGVRENSQLYRHWPCQTSEAESERSIPHSIYLQSHAGQSRRETSLQVLRNSVQDSRGLEWNSSDGSVYGRENWEGGPVVWSLRSSSV